jgi:outer membrane protein TolC
MEDLAVQVTQSYFSVLLAKINRENAKLNVARDDSIYKIAQGRYKVGTITEPDLLQTELEFHNAQRALTTSRINYNRNINNFKILLGYPTSVTLSLKEPKNLPEISVNIVKAQRLAMQNNSLSLSFQLDKLQADKQLARARSQNGLSATLSANYGLNKRSGRFSDLYQHPLSQQFITVGFHLPLYDWGKHRAQIKSAENQERSTVNNIKFQRRQFMQKVQYQVKNFLQLRNQAKLATESDTIAVRRYHVAENRYRIGKINITDLFLAQGAKDSARQNYIRALEDFWTGWYNLRKLTLYDFQDDEPIRHTF